MPDYVFDTEPLIAFLYDEPGAATVADRLRAIQDGEASGSIAHATATELVYKVARLETGDPNHTEPDRGEYEVGERDLRILRGYDLGVETPSIATVARIKGSGGISLGDAYAAALAVDQGATLVVGADPEFGAMQVDVDYVRVRDDPAT